MGRVRLNIQDIISQFLMVKPKKKVFGNYRIEDNFLLYQAQSSTDATRWNDAASFRDAKKAIGEKIKNTDGRLVDENGKTVMLEACTHATKNYGFKILFHETNTIAVKAPSENNLVLVNSEVLDLVGRTMAYGREDRNDRLTEIQLGLRGLSCPMLPLSEFLDADWKTFKAIEKGRSVSVAVKTTIGNGYSNRRDIETTQSVCSGLLFDLDGKRYLASIDKRETTAGRIIPTLNPVAKTANSISEAIDATKPKAVRDAEVKGLDVKRGGDLYFIPCETPVFEKLSQDEILTILGEKCEYDLGKDVLLYLTGLDISKSEEKSARLLEKVPRPMDIGENASTKIGIIQNGETLVIGAIEFRNRVSVKLATWHKVIKAD